MERSETNPSCRSDEMIWERCDQGQASRRRFHFIHVISATLKHVSMHLAEEFTFDLKLVHQEKTFGFAFPAFQWNKNEAQGERTQSQVVSDVSDNSLSLCWCWSSLQFGHKAT